MHRISKTDYISGCLCEKRLWLSKHKPEVCIDTETARTRDGDEVGALARAYFPGAVTVPLNAAPAMAQMTQRLMQEGHRVICEATFMANGLTCAADIVRVHPDGLDIIEVKSSTSVKDIQKEDVAFQCHVILCAGYNIRSVKLMHLNKEYIRNGGLDLQQLFVMTDLGVPLQARSGDVSRNVSRFKEVCNQSCEPVTSLACRCEKPHECPCRAYCFQQAQVPEQSVFNVSGMTAKKKYELYQMGIITPEQLHRAEHHLTERQASHVRSMLCHAPEDSIYVNKEAIQRFLASVRYPLHLLDFETSQRAVPQYDGLRPYAQVPFQYSLHVKESVSGRLRHLEHLAETGVDPRRELAEKLCRDIPVGAQTMAYNASFEKSVCRHLAEMYPNLRAPLHSIADNMLDLMIPFRNQWVTTPSMHGSYSIKAVLPALCGNDPEIDYHQLPVVHNGAEAMEQFSVLPFVKDENEVKRIRDGLLLYCRLDTLAMSKVLEALYNLAYD